MSAVVAVLVIVAGFASALRGIVWDVMAVIGITLTSSTVLLMGWCWIATLGQRKERTPPEPEVIDDALPQFFKRSPGLPAHVREAIEQMQREGGGA